MRVNGKERKKKEVVFGPVTLQCGYDDKGEPEFWDFLAVPVWDRDEFNQLCPEPMPPVRGYKPDGSKTYDTEGKTPAGVDYKRDIKLHGLRWWGYLILKSLEPSNIQWDMVSLDDPETWSLVEDELRADLAHYEFGKVTDLVEEANAISLEKLEENRRTFWQRRALLAQQKNSPDGENPSTPDGEPVSDPTLTQDSGTS